MVRVKAGLALLLCVAATARAATPAAAPVLPYLDWGACPFECCTYREWTAAHAVDAFATRDVHGTRRFELAAGERVQALTGVVVTTRAGVAEVIAPVQLGYRADGTGPALSLVPGERLYLLHDQGEGSVLFWYHGQTYAEMIPAPGANAPLTVRVRSQATSEWWVQVRNAAGQTGWVLTRPDSFRQWDRCG
jgi:hypothetical protein